MALIDAHTDLHAATVERGNYRRDNLTCVGMATRTCSMMLLAQLRVRLTVRSAVMPTVM